MRGLRRLGRFPAVSARSAKEGRSYEAAWQRWRDGPHQGLRIMATLATPVLPGAEQGVHLDGVLSAAVLSSRLVGASVSKVDDHVVPLPLALAWVDDDGRPLWAATDLRSMGPATEAEIYLHKRYPTDRAELAAKRGVLTSAGRYKDVRMPLRAIATWALVGWCIGIAEDVRSLLSGMTHVGRKGAIGQGRVLTWGVEPDPVDLDWVLDRRSVPLAALGTAAVPADRVAPRESWTPPYWDARRHAPCRSAAWTP